MKSIITVVALVFVSLETLAQEPPLPIIDMHLHSYDEGSYFVAPDHFGNMAPPTVEAHFDATYDIMRRHGIVMGVISGPTSSEEEWMAKDEDHRFLRGFSSDDWQEWTPESFAQLVKEGKIDVFGEIGAYYHGKTLADPFFDPYLKICEENGIPVAIHTGGGPPEVNYRGAPNARLVLGNPLLIEDVLVKYPKLKIYLMHAGEIFFNEALRLMLAYPQVHADLGVLLWVHPMPKHYGREFVAKAKEFGMLDRVMFGSDQMVWPHGIEMSLEQLESFDFLTEDEKRDILYNNAARFLGLSQEEVDAHHNR
ncbi:MAG: amidohydrolase family protein [Candidatus Krumholzibacteriota bacterium]